MRSSSNVCEWVTANPPASKPAKTGLIQVRPICSSMDSETFAELIVSERDILKQAISMAKSLLGVTEETGQVFLRIPRSQLSARDALALHLIGQYFLKEMGKAESSRVSLSDLVKRALVDHNIASARLAELANAGWITRTAKGEFDVNPHMLNGLLGEIQASKGKVSPEPQTPANQVKKSATVELPRGASEAILFVLGSEWGKQPRDWKEIRDEMRRNGLHFSEGSISGTLTLLTQSHRLRRMREGRFYKYVLA